MRIIALIYLSPGSCRGRGSGLSLAGYHIFTPENACPPNAPDPVGRVPWRLSGRRAQAIYAALVRDTGLWEAIYSDPFLGDQWGSASVATMLQAMGYEVKPGDGLKKNLPSDALKKFQQDKGAVPNGQNTKATRTLVFEAYMDWLCGDLKLDKSRFLARGADPKGKGDYQGCSEFNPILLFSKDENKELEKDKPKRNEEKPLPKGKGGK